MDDEMQTEWTAARSSAFETEAVKVVCEVGLLWAKIKDWANHTNVKEERISRKPTKHGGARYCMRTATFARIRSCRRMMKLHADGMNISPDRQC